MSTHPDAPRIEQANEVAGIIITVTEKVHPGEFVTLDLRYGIADALWAAGYRKVTYKESIYRAIADSLDGFSKNEHGDFVALQAERIYNIATNAVFAALGGGDK